MFAPVPEPVARVAALMSTFRRNWYLCGGWAVDAWLGRQTRDHLDIDITAFEEDQRAIFEHLAGWQLVAHDINVDQETSEPWDGRRLELPAHVHAAHGGLKLEVLLNERSGHDWILSPDPRIALPLSRCARESPWRLPTAVPEVVLFYKATAYFGVAGMKDRSHDELDFFALLPQLTDEQRDWLLDAVSLLHPGHPWLTRLSATRQ